MAITNEQRRAFLEKNRTKSRSVSVSTSTPQIPVTRTVDQNISTTSPLTTQYNVEPNKKTGLLGLARKTYNKIASQNFSLSSALMRGNTTLSSILFAKEMLAKRKAETKAERTTGLQKAKAPVQELIGRQKNISAKAQEFGFDALVRPITRTLASVATPGVSTLAGKQTDKFTPKGKVQQKIFGKEPIRSVDVAKSLRGGYTEEEQSVISRAVGKDTLDFLLTVAPAGVGTKVLQSTVRHGAKKLSLELSKKATERTAGALGRGVVGTTLGGLYKIEDEDASLVEIIKTAGFAGLAAAGAGPLAGLLGKGFKGMFSKASSFATPKVKAGLAKLEEFALKQPKKSLGGALGDVQKSFNRGKTTQQLLAKKFLTAVRVLEKTQDLFLNSYRPFAVLDNQLSKRLGRELNATEKLETAAQLSSPRAFERARAISEEIGAVDQSLDEISPGLSEVFRSYLKAFDIRDRSELVEKLSGGVTRQQAVDAIEQTRREYPQFIKELDSAKSYVHTVQKSMILELLDEGLLKPSTVKNIFETHPNYIPNKKFIDTINTAVKHSGVTESFNISSSVLKKAVGSDRIDEDPLLAIQHSMVALTSALEKNKTMRALGERLEQSLPFTKKARLVESAEQVLEREDILVEMKALSNEIKRTKHTIKKVERTDLLKVRRLRKLQREVDELSEKAVKTFLEGVEKPAKAGSVFLKRIESRADELRRVKSDKIKARIFTQVKTEKLRGLSKQITLQRKILEPASKEFFERVSRIVEGGEKNIAIMGKMKKFESAQKQLRTLLKEKEDVLKSVFKESAEKETKITYKTIAKTDSIKVAIQKRLQNFRKRNGELLALKDRIATRETKISKTLKQKEVGENIIDISISGLEKQTTRMKVLLSDLHKQTKNKPSELSMQEQGLGTISFYKKGAKETWIVPNRLETAIKNLSHEELSSTMKWLSRATGTPLLRQLATGKNPSFFLPNVARDVQSAAVNSKFGIAADTFAEGLFKTRPDLYKEAALQGSFMGAGLIGKDSYLSKAVNASEDVLWHKIKSKSNVGIIDEIAGNFENATRYSVYWEAIKGGASKTEAAELARNATVDFGRSGSVIRTLNKFVPFLNARVQGVDKMLRSTAKDPERVVNTLFWTAAVPEVYLYQHNRQFASYGNIPQRMLDNYHVIMHGEVEGLDEAGDPVMIPQYSTLPKGEAQKVISMVINHVLKSADNIDPRGTREVLIDVLGSASPLPFNSFNSKDFASSIASSLGPAVRIGAGLFSNIDPFTGFNIVPERKLDSDKEFQIKQSTTETAKSLARKFDASPARLEFIFDSFGGLPKDVLRLGDIAQGKQQPSLSGTDFGKLSRTPLFRTFFRESNTSQSLQNIRNTKIIENIRKEGTREKDIQESQDNVILREYLRTKPNNRVEKWDSMVKEGLITKENAKRIKNRINKAKTYNDSALNSLGVENWGRANAIKQILETVEGDEYTELWDNYVKKKIITTKVAKQIKILLREEKEK